MSAPSEVVVATLMRPAGGSGVPSHVRTFAGHLRDASYPITVITPFESEARLLRPAAHLRTPAGSRVLSPRPTNG